MIGAMGIESFTDRLENFPREKLAVVVGDRADVQALAIQEGVRLLILTGGLPVKPEIIAAAQTRQVSVLTSPQCPPASVPCALMLPCPSTNMRAIPTTPSMSA